MATIKDLFQKGRLVLRDFPNPALEARLLLQKAACISEEEFLASPGKNIPEELEKKYYRFISNRLRGVPLSYITGVKEFWSIPFRVSPAVLIPRPETELLVDKVLELSSSKEEVIVDIGTGCGNIAVSIAKELPQATIYATDISKEALKTARKNAQMIKSNNITFVHGHLLEPLKRINLKGKCDFIISNPPYVSEAEWNMLPSEIRNYEPREALVAGHTGLEVIKEIILDAPLFLKPGARLILEIGEGQRNKVASLFDSRWHEVNFYNDLSGIPRVVTASSSLVNSKE